MMKRRSIPALSALAALIALCAMTGCHKSQTSAAGSDAHKTYTRAELEALYAAHRPKGNIGGPAVPAAPAPPRR